MNTEIDNLLIIKENWYSDWKASLHLWSDFIQLKEPIFYVNSKEAEKFLGDGIAAIRLDDHTVMINLVKLKSLNLETFSLELLSHEIGHHVYCPGNLTNYAKMMARVQKAMPDLKHYASFVLNLYEDLMINNRLKRNFNLNFEKIYIVMNGDSPQSSLWQFYMRIYELLWALPKNTLSKGENKSSFEGDAILGKNLIQVYSDDFIRGSGRFACLCYHYLQMDDLNQSKQLYSYIKDTKNIGSDKIPDGLLEFDPDEDLDVIHPALELDITVSEEESEKDFELKNIQISNKNKAKNQQKKYRDPFDFKGILKDIGINLNDHEIISQYYKKRALPYLIPYPTKIANRSTEPLNEGVEVWEIGSPMENINWFQSALNSPIPIPGYSIVEDYFGTTEGSNPDIEPIDLDIYIDCSGSMPNPGHSMSFLALAGTIIVLSALRTGARIQATLWSGEGQFKSTEGFISNEKEILKIVTGYLGGSTAFPIGLLDKTYRQRKDTDRKVHILQISDDGITTMYDTDKNGNDGYKISSTAIKKSKGGASMVLNIYNENYFLKELDKLEEQGWDISIVKDWESLIEFAKNFSKKNYGKK
jgi:hypothetical protein